MRQRNLLRKNVVPESHSCLINSWSNGPAQGRYLLNSKWAPCEPDQQALQEDAERSRINNIAGNCFRAFSQICTHIFTVDGAALLKGSHITCPVLSCLKGPDCHDELHGQGRTFVGASCCCCCCSHCKHSMVSAGAVIRRNVAAHICFPVQASHLPAVVSSLFVQAGLQQTRNNGLPAHPTSIPSPPCALCKHKQASANTTRCRLPLHQPAPVA